MPPYATFSSLGREQLSCRMRLTRPRSAATFGYSSWPPEMGGSPSQGLNELGANPRLGVGNGRTFLASHGRLGSGPPVRGDHDSVLHPRSPILLRPRSAHQDAVDVGAQSSQRRRPTAPRVLPAAAAVDWPHDPSPADLGHRRRRPFRNGLVAIARPPVCGGTPSGRHLDFRRLPPYASRTASRELLSAYPRSSADS